MGIVIAVVAPVIVLAIAAGAVAAYRIHRRSAPEAWGRPQDDQCGHHIGERCPCGRGRLVQAWRHGQGAVLGCTRYPQCRVWFGISGEPVAGQASQLRMPVR